MDYRHHGLRAPSALDSFSVRDLKTLSLWSATSPHKAVDSIYPYMGIGLVKVGIYPHADGPCTYTSGAPTCSEIPKTFAWDRKVPSSRSVPREGRFRVLLGERLCTRKRRFTQFTTPFTQRAI